MSSINPGRDVSDQKKREDEGIFLAEEGQKKEEAGQQGRRPSGRTDKDEESAEHKSHNQEFGDIAGIYHRFDVDGVEGKESRRPEGETIFRRETSRQEPDQNGYQ